MIDGDQVAGAEPGFAPQGVPHLPVKVDGIVHVHAPDIVVDPPEETPLAGRNLCHHLVYGANPDRTAEKFMHRAEGAAMGTAAGGLEIAVDVIGLPEAGDRSGEPFEIGKAALVNRLELPSCRIIEKPAPDLLGLAEDYGVGMTSRLFRESRDMDPPEKHLFSHGPQPVRRPVNPGSLGGEDREADQVGIQLLQGNALLVGVDQLDLYIRSDLHGQPGKVLQHRRSDRKPLGFLSLLAERGGYEGNFHWVSLANPGYRKYGTNLPAVQLFQGGNDQSAVSSFLARSREASME